MKNKRLMLMIISIFMLFMIIFGASYSYFAAQGVGSGDDRQVTTTVGELKLTYADGSEYLTTNGGFEPGDYLTKTFTVTNNSSATAYYRIYMNDVVNTFIMQKKDEEGNTISDAPYELIYILKKNEEVVINEASNTPVLSEDGVIYGVDGLGIEIEKGATDIYELTIKFIDTEENQNYNQTKLFKTSIKLTPSTMRERFITMMTTRDDIAYDDYGNIRFVGKDANNYLSFNGEEWRIVGLFNEMDEVQNDGSTVKQSLIKIVRSENLGNGAWSSTNKNDWTTATLMNLLNDDYLNNEGKYTETSTIKSLASVFNYIATVKWNIGGHNDIATTPRKMYIKERGNTGCGINKNNIIWEGKVALLYPSDYGYSVKGNDNTKDNVNCLNTNMSVWNSNGCAVNTWLFNKSHQWLLTPSTSNRTDVYRIAHLGLVDNHYVSSIVFNFRPALYLKHDIQLTGTGERGENIFRIVE